MKNILTERIYHGSAYYPEQWSKDDIKKDIEIMKELGLNNVRMMEFAWSVIEKHEGMFDFSLFDYAIEEFYKAGIFTILCTPTATPPRWFSVKYPESLYVDKNLQPLNHGSREHICVNNENYIEKCKIITEEIAKHYKDNNAIIAYQIHNEPNCPVTECFCSKCREKWSIYLENRYKKIENLNESWGNRVWSFEYPDFKSVLPPVPTPYLHSTSHKSVYKEFNYQSVAEFITIQADIIRKYTNKPVTTNIFRSFELDYDMLFQNLDFVGIDEYSTQSAYPESTLNFDRWRNTCKNPYFIMETPPSYAGNIVEVLPYHNKNYIKALAMSSFFGGGTGFNYWQYRQSKSGAEMPHGHIVSACQKETPSFKNIKQVSASIEKYSNFLLNSEPMKAEVALVYSDKGRTFSLTENLKEYNYYSDILNSYKAVERCCVYRDIITENNNFDGYKIIYAPYLCCISENLKTKLLNQAEKGATVIIGAYSGWRTTEHTLYTENVLGDFEKQVGKEIKYITQLKEQGFVEAFGVKTKITGHTAVFEYDKNSIGLIQGGFCDGMSAVEEVSFGKGKIVYAIFKAEEDFETALIINYVKEKIITKIYYDFGIAYYIRKMNNETFHCFVNMQNEVKQIYLPDNRIIQIVSGDSKIITGNFEELNDKNF